MLPELPGAVGHVDLLVVDFLSLAVVEFAEVQLREAVEFGTLQGVVQFANELAAVAHLVSVSVRCAVVDFLERLVHGVIQIDSPVGPLCDHEGSGGIRSNPMQSVILAEAGNGKRPFGFPRIHGMLRSVFAGLLRLLGDQGHQQVDLVPVRGGLLHGGLVRSRLRDLVRGLGEAFVGRLGVARHELRELVARLFEVVRELEGLLAVAHGDVVVADDVLLELA